MPNLFWPPRVDADGAANFINRVEKCLLPLGNFNQHPAWVFTEVPQEAVGYMGK
jgi:hypothetical protein